MRDETVNPATNEFYPRGRCDTCGAPCDDMTGDCTADATHATALSGEEGT